MNLKSKLCIDFIVDYEVYYHKLMKDCREYKCKYKIFKE